MRFIKKNPDINGAYFPIQSWNEAAPPDGYYQVADGVELSCGGFGALTVEDNIVTAFTPDVEAWEAWQAEHPAPEPEISTETDLMNMAVDHEYRLTILELGV